eukprot:sb/3468363/
MAPPSYYIQCRVAQIGDPHDDARRPQHTPSVASIPSHDNNRHNMQFSLKLGHETIHQVDNYCYRGLNISSPGDFSKAASSDLTTTATRAMYGLRGTIMKEQLSFKSTLSLFNSLIKPIALYGAPIWSPQLPDAKTTIKIIGSNDPTLIRKLSSTKLNRLHLSYLKWTMGVNRKTTNAAVYGDTGTRPLSLEALDITTKYLQRIAKLPSRIRFGPMHTFGLQPPAVLSRRSSSRPPFHRHNIICPLLPEGQFLITSITTAIFAY